MSVAIVSLEFCAGLCHEICILNGSVANANCFKYLWPFSIEQYLVTIQRLGPAQCSCISQLMHYLFFLNAPVKFSLITAC